MRKIIKTIGSMFLAGTIMANAYGFKNFDANAEKPSNLDMKATTISYTKSPEVINFDNYANLNKMMVLIEGVSPLSMDFGLKSARKFLQNDASITLGLITNEVTEEKTKKRFYENIAELVSEYPEKIELALEPGELDVSPKEIVEIIQNAKNSINEYCKSLNMPSITSIIPYQGKYNKELFKCAKQTDLVAIFGDKFPVSYRSGYSIIDDIVEIEWDYKANTIAEWETPSLREPNSLLDIVKKELEEKPTDDPINIIIYQRQISNLLDKDKGLVYIDNIINGLKEIKTKKQFIFTTPGEFYENVQQGIKRILDDNHFFSLFVDGFDKENVDRLSNYYGRVIEENALSYESIGNARIILGRLNNNPELFLSSLTYLELALKEAINPNQRLLLSEQLAFLKSQAGMGKDYFVKAANIANQQGINWKADLYESIASNKKIDMNLEPIIIETNPLDVPVNSKKIIIGNSSIVIKNDYILSTQVDRVSQDWFSEIIGQPTTTINNQNRPKVQWMEGKRINDLLNYNPKGTSMPISGVIVIKSNGKFYALDNKGIPRFEVLSDKIQYSSTLHYNSNGNDFYLIIDTHGISAIEQGAINSNLVIGCGDYTAKMEASYQLVKNGVNVWTPTDRFSDVMIGYKTKEGYGTWLGSAPVRPIKDGFIIGDTPLEIKVDEKIIVETTNKPYPLQYNDSPYRYFSKLEELCGLDLNLEVVDVSERGQLEKLIEKANKESSNVIAVRVCYDEDYKVVKEWLASSPEHRAILFHTIAYEPGKRLFAEFPNQTTFGDPHPVFSQGEYLTLNDRLETIPQTKPLTSKDYDMLGKSAWDYFKDNTNPKTGLANTIVVFNDDGEPFYKHKEGTLWEVGSNILAIISAQNLGYIKRDESTKRISQILNFLDNMELFKNEYGEIPSNVYNFETGDIKKEKYGCNITDIARTLSSMYHVKKEYPEFETKIQEIISSWDLEDIIRRGATYEDIESNGAQSQEGVYPYSEYIKQSFNEMNIAHYQTSMEGKLVPVKIGNSFVVVPFGKDSLLTSDPYILLELEYLSNPLKEEGKLVYETQLRRFIETGIPTALSEGSIEKSPFFVFPAVTNENFEQWPVQENISKESSYPNLRYMATDASIAFLAIYDDAYSRFLVRKIMDSGLIRNDGVANGIYEIDNKIIPLIESNTQSIILESLNYIYNKRK